MVLLLAILLVVFLLAPPWSIRRAVELWEARCAEGADRGDTVR